MGRWLGRFAGMVVVAAICSAVLFVLPMWLGGATPVQSAMMLAIVYGAIAAAWTGEFMFRKSFPNLFRQFEKERQNRTYVGDGDE